jgi:drug/metabolite transporter (DMT)-like permease
MMVCHFAAFLVSTLFNLSSGNVLVPQLSQLPGLLWIGVGTSAIAYTAWALALSLGDTAKLSNLAYVTPFLSLIWTALLLKEPVSLYSVLGLVVIVVGILLQIKEKKRRDPNRVIRRKAGDDWF